MRREMASGGVKKNMGVKKDAPKAKGKAEPEPEPKMDRPRLGRGEAEAKPERPRLGRAEPENPERPRLGKAEKPEKPKQPPRIDFIQRNIDEAAEQKSRAKQKVTTKKEKVIAQRHAPGEIPQYIESRKEAIRAEKEPPKKPDMPPGMRLLSEEEKQEAIENLMEQKKDIESQLAKFSLRLESPTILREKRVLEDELDQIEKSIEQLSKKFVFVPDDDDD